MNENKDGKKELNKIIVITFEKLTWNFNEIIQNLYVEFIIVSAWNSVYLKKPTLKGIFHLNVYINNIKENEIFAHSLLFYVSTVSSCSCSVALSRDRNFYIFFIIYSSGENSFRWKYFAFINLFLLNRMNLYESNQNIPKIWSFLQMYTLWNFLSFIKSCEEFLFELINFNYENVCEIHAIFFS